MLLQILNWTWWALAAVFGVRVLAGWVRTMRWRPVGDPLLVAAMTETRPRITGRLACVVLDLSKDAGRSDVRQAFNRCDERTVFEIGSVTKALTGMLLADAIERGEVTPHMRLGQALPELASVPAGEATLADLARHRSGLPGTSLGRFGLVRILASAYAGLDPYRRITPAALLRIATRTQMRAAGTQKYSNLGAALAGHAIARGADSDFATVLRERITVPLGLAATSADPARPRRSGRGWLGAWAQPWRLDGYAPAGGVTSTLTDMTVLLRSLLNEDAPGMAALSDGLFWQVYTTAHGHRRIWHNGETGAYCAYLAVYPEARRGVAVLFSHADAAYAERLAGACITMVRR